ncbi:MAG: ribosome maturation factor RimM [Actinomycetota bacterium]|nr:ribosome maturation factor RimM [Actinomycetota bacterium]
MDLVVARIGKPHSLKGEVTVQLHTDDPQARFVPGVAFATRAAPGTGVPTSLTLRSARLHNGTWLLAFEEIPDRSGAESLRGTQLVADIVGAAEGPEAPGSESTADDDEGWYEDQLVGLEVVLTDGTRVGAVSALEIGAAQDLLVVALDAGHTGYVPFVEAIVPTVDLAGGRVVIDPPAGLLDLNA